MNRRKRLAVIVAAIIIVFVGAFVSYRVAERNRRDNVPKWSGGPLYVYDVFIGDGIIWCLRYSSHNDNFILNTCSNEDDELTIREFSWSDLPVVYNASRSLFYYVNKSTLMQYDPYNGIESSFCVIGHGRKTITALTDNHIVIRNDDPDKSILISLITYEVTEIGRVPNMVLDTYGDKIAFIGVSSNENIVYDCFTQSKTYLSGIESLTASSIVGGAVISNSLFYVPGAMQGFLYVIEEFDSDNIKSPQRVEAVNRYLISVASFDDYLVCAFREGYGSGQIPISFYMFHQDEGFYHVATWDKAHYWNVGSFGMKIENGYLAACIKTQDNVFVHKLD